MKTSILSLSALSTNALSTNLFGRIKSATPLTRLVTLILTTLLLAACGGGGGGGGSSSPSVKEPALKTILDSSIDGIVLRWTNPDDVRNITITRSVYANSTAATPVSTPVSESHNNMTSKPELVAAGSITINVTGLPANKYYSFNITRGFDNNITDTIVSSRQYLSPDFVGNVTAALTTTGSGTSTELSLSWINPANVAGIASVRIIRNEFINSTVTEPLSTTMVRTGNIVGTATASDPSVPTNINVNITGLSINRYYTFTVTQIYTGNVEGPTSDPSARQYLPPAIVGTVTATLGEGGISVLLSWINPRNVAGIAAVRITRNEFANSTSSVSTATIYAPDFTDADAIASTNAGRTAATLNITSGLRADRYYTFSVAPIYTDITGDLVGPASSVSKLVGPLSSSLGDLEASLGATRAAGSATLTFNNPANVASITWTATAYNAATGGSVIRDLAPAQAYSGTINTQPEGASIPITGLATNQYYAFTIVRNLKPDSGGNTPPAITSDVSNRLYLPPTASGVTANLNTAKTGLILSWTNPQNFPGITAVRVIRQVYTSESGVAGVPVSTMITDASALAAGSVSIDIPGLPTDRYYSFTIAPIYDGGAGNADILAPTSAPSARQYIPPVTLNNVATTLNSDKTSVVLSWTNPRNAAGIKAVRIIRNEYADATTTDALSTEPTMITEVADSVNLDIPGLNPNSYYEFTVTPIYNAGARAAIPNADIEGLVSTPSARQYIPPATTATNVVTTLNSGGTSVLLSWTNPQSASGIKAVRITRREFADATTDVSTTTIDTPDYSVGSAVATNASLDLANGLSPNSYYSFTVTPIYNAGAKAATPGADILGFPTAPSARQYIPPAIGGVTATLSERNILAVLSWTNPQNVAGITAVRITIHEYADASAEDPIMVMDTSAYTDATAIATDASLDITSELNPDSYYEFTVTPLYNSGTVGADIVGPASALSTRVGPIGASADFATLTAMLNTDRDGIALSYNNPDSVRSITVTPTSYDSATATTGVLGTATTYSSQNTSPISFTEGKRVLALTGLVTNKYYTFTITRHLVSGGAINSAASTRQYLPPTAIDVVTSPTRPNGNVVILSWRNPQNLAGIKAVRIAWNEYANVTTNVVLGTNTADYTDATAIATSTTAAAEASLDVSSTLNPNRYYTFTVTPIYNGGAGNADIVGPRSAPSFRRYFPPAIVGDVTATLSSSNAGVTLSWTNAPNIGMEGVGVIYREYVDATATEPLAVSAYQFAKAASVRAENATINLPMDIISPSQAAPINLDSYYTFSVTPIYNGDGKQIYGPASEFTTARLYISPAVGDLTATLATDFTKVALSWTNPQSIFDITAVRITRDEFAAFADTEPLDTDIFTLTDPADIAVGNANIEIAGLNPNSYYTFTITPIHTGNMVGSAATTARLYIPPAIVGDVTTTLNAAKNGAMLSWTNAPNIGMAGVEVIYREYVDATATEPLAVIDEQFARTDSVKAEDATINVPMDIFSPSPAVLLNSNRYYTFTVTPIYVDDGGETDGPVSAPSARQYFPPAAAVNDLSAALSADKTSVVLSWSNPQSAAAITSVRVTRNEFVDATTTVPATSLDTTDYMDASAIVSSATGTAAATLEIPVLTPNRYYTFTVTPIYDGGNADIVGFTTAPSNRQYLPPPIVGSATATLNAATSAASTGIVVSWTNPQSIIGIESIKVSRQAYLTLDGDDMTGSVEPTILTDPAFLTAGAASTDLAGFATDRYYTFTVTPIYAGNIEGPTSAATNPRVILLGVPGVRDLSAAVAAAQVRLTWTNPPDVRNITITQTTGSGPEIEILSNSAVANLIKQGSEAIHYVQGLSGSEEFVLKVIPTYPGDVDGSASATATLRLRPGHSDFDDVLDTADIDVDGDGLIELDNVNDLNRMRDDLAGASFAGSTSGCGGDVDSENNPITSCKGYELTAPVDLNELEPDTSLSNWQPVGGCASENATSCLTNAFTGSFDGNNHKISNLRLMLNRSAYGVGLFGAVDNSQLDNIVLRDVSITSSADGDFLGSLVGYANNAIITRSAVDIRSINAGSTNFVGGLVGYANATNVVSAISIGNSITGKLHIGGLLGACTFGCVTSSSFAAVTNMSALLDIGGLVGYANHHGGKIIFSGAATNNLIATFSSIGGVLGLLDVGVEPFQFFSASYAILNGLRSRGGAGPLYTSIPESSFPVGQSIYYNDKIDRNFPSYPLAPLYLAFSRLQPAAFADNGNGADFTQWQYAWCDTATGEFTEDRSSDLATGLNINGVNAWDLVPDNSVMRTDMTNNFPVPACTPFSPATIRAAIGKVRLGEGPVSLD